MNLKSSYNLKKTLVESFWKCQGITTPCCTVSKTVVCLTISKEPIKNHNLNSPIIVQETTVSRQKTNDFGKKN